MKEYFTVITFDAWKKLINERDFDSFPDDEDIMDAINTTVGADFAVVEKRYRIGE